MGNIYIEILYYIGRYGEARTKFQGQTAVQNVFGVERGGFGVGRLYQITQAFN